MSQMSHQRNRSSSTVHDEPEKCVPCADCEMLYFPSDALINWPPRSIGFAGVPCHLVQTVFRKRVDESVYVFLTVVASTIHLTRRCGSVVHDKTKQCVPCAGHKILFAIQFIRDRPVAHGVAQIGMP